MENDRVDDLVEGQQAERLRVNAKANSKGEYSFDATFEDTALAVDVDTATSKVLEAIKQLNQKFTDSGIKIAGK